jgi:hypothetical protein
MDTKASLSNFLKAILKSTSFLNFSVSPRAVMAEINWLVGHFWQFCMLSHGQVGHLKIINAKKIQQHNKTTILYHINCSNCFQNM